MANGHSPLGENIKKALVDRDLSQEALARRLDVSRQTVFNWCSGRTEPKYAQVQAVADELGIANVASLYARQEGKAA